MQGRNILIVEDDAIQSLELARFFEDAGARIIGPTKSASAAEALLEGADGAVLDIKVLGGSVFPLATKLSQLGIPFVFYTGYANAPIPAEFRSIAKVIKPFRPCDIVEALSKAQADPFLSADLMDSLHDIDDPVRLIPKLRMTANLLLHDPEAADRMVQATLQNAIANIRNKPDEQSLSEWLSATFTGLMTGQIERFQN